MKYTTLKIPTTTIIFFMGLSGFMGCMSFIATIFNNIVIGFIAGCFGFTIIIISCRYMGKTVVKQKEMEK